MKEIWAICPCCKHEFLTPVSTPEKDLERQGQLQLEAHPEVFSDDQDEDDDHSHKRG